MTPDDLGRARVPSDPQVHADGRVVFTLTQMNLDGDRYDRDLWMHRDGEARRFTTGGSDSHPRWSPNGDNIAFLRKVDKAAQIAVIPAAGGEARVVTEFELGVEGFEWSPDGSTIAAVAITRTDEWSELSEEDRQKQPRRVTSVPYRFDTIGWTHDRRRHIWLVPVDGSESRCLTPGDFDERTPAWSPDGSKIVALTDRSEGRGLEPGTDVVEIDVETGDITPAVSRGNWFCAAYAPDGTLHLLGDDSTDWPGVSTVWRRESDGTLRSLTEHLDRSSTSLAAGPSRLLFVGDDVLTALEDGGSSGVIRVVPDGTVHHLVTGQRVVTSFHSVDGETLVFAASEMTEPGKLVRWTSGSEEDLTNFNDDLDFIEGHHFQVPSGGVEIDAWVYLPTEGETYPGLVNIHGGPASQYGFGFFDEFQIYAAAGYAVIACNPRGSSGRGLDYVSAVVGDGWGVVDTEDIGNVVEAALQRYPHIDPDRLGVMGGSYGGFMTGWLTAHEDRWKSAVVERALLNFVSFAGTSDIGATFPRFYTKADYPDAWETWWEKSPLAYVDQVKTPTLVIHSENDYRCPIEQGEQWFMALLRNGVPTEMLRFPDESHELTRSGGPKHRRQRFEAILDWHARHL
ncbi:MAG: S9 family peptidase [Acidimicrobiia bacterium]